MPALGEAMVSSEKLRLMVKVARMYYERGLRQSQIADELNITQTRVSRVLKAAQEAGVVRTIVSVPAGVHSELEDALERTYRLRAAVITEAGSGEDALLSAIGAAGAGYLEATLIGHESIGLSSWSGSLMQVAEALPEFRGQVADIVVQLMGGRSESALQLEANRLLTRLAALTGAKPVFLNAPGMVASAQEVATLLDAPYLREATEAWSSLTLALVGVGSLEPSPLARESGNRFSDEALAELQAAGAVGDVCFRVYDRDGKLVDSELNNTVVGISPDVLKAIPRRVGVAGGALKVEAIRGALRGGWVNVLVTDLETATALLD